MDFAPVASTSSQKRHRIFLETSSEESESVSSEKATAEQLRRRKQRKIKKPLGSYFMDAIEDSDLDEIKVPQDDVGESIENEDFQVLQTLSQSSDEEEEIPDIDTPPDQEIETHYDIYKKKDAKRKRLQRALESKEKKLEIRKKDAARRRAARENETEEQTQTRRQRDNEWRRASRAAESAHKRQERLAREAQSRKKKAAHSSKCWV